MKDVIVTFEVITESNLVFNIIDLTCQSQVVVVGDLETIQSQMVEEFIPSQVKVHIGYTDLGLLIGDSLKSLGFEVSYLEVRFE